MSSRGKPFKSLLTSLAEEIDALSAQDQANLSLRMGVRHNEEKAVEKALAAGADPRELNHQGRCCLMIAAECGCWSVIPILLGVCDPKARDGSGLTALMIAAREGKFPCVERLSAHSDLTDRDASGLLASEQAYAKGHVNAWEHLKRLEPAALEAQALRQATEGSVDPLAPSAPRGPRL